MKILLKIIYALIGIFGILLLLWFGMPDIRKAFEPVKIIPVLVKLDNKCTVANDAFIVTVPGTDLQFPFKNGIVKLRLRSDRKLQLKSNPKYPAIRYEGMHEEVKKNVILEADCSSSPRIKGIFKSMNDRFKKE
tara:strand:+ start:652 stop:1053 length:402 start_codon:yes stop_codon:yes gene_type:complete